MFSKRASSKDGLYSRCKPCKRKEAGTIHGWDRQPGWEERRAEREKLSDKLRRHENRLVTKVKSAEYYIKNKDTIRQRCVAYTRKRKAIDPVFKMRCTIASIISNAFTSQGVLRRKRVEGILGCTYENFLEHLALTAVQNYGVYLFDENYHIDHIVPVSLADTEDELLQLNHYTNLQLLTAADNLFKKDRIGFDPRDRQN